jgi:hypothetical protein
MTFMSLCHAERRFAAFAKRSRRTSAASEILCPAAFLLSSPARLRGPLPSPAYRWRGRSPRLMSPQNYSPAAPDPNQRKTACVRTLKHGPRDGLFGLGKEHRRCHRLGDDFVGCLLPPLRGPTTLSQNSRNPSLEGPINRRCGHLWPTSACLGEESWSPSQPSC